MKPPEFEFAFEVRAQVAAPLDLGETQRGHRRIVPILGGVFEGPSIRGRVLAGGADWQILRADGVAELEARYTLETSEGGLIYVVNRAMRRAPPEVMSKLLAGEPVDPAQVYFRCAPVFETSAPGLEWMTQSVFVGTGERHPAEVVIGFWRIK